MIAPAEPGSDISCAPTPQIVRAANAAAASPHALVNLIRLVKSLESSSLDTEDEEGVGQTAPSGQITRDIYNAKYARVLLETLRKGNEESSTTSSTLDGLSRNLVVIENRYTRLSTSSSTPADPRPKSPQRTAVSPPTYLQTPLAQTDAVNPPEGIIASETIPTPSIRLRHRKAPILSEYLASRETEDARGDEAGLIPLRVRSTTNAPSSRDQLLGGTGGAGLGAAQLHEELGGQLADMSHRLKLNAVHFANSLEEEKALLETSQQTLENNLSSTRSSKKNLSAVSRKSRGTTCMTLGIVLLVLIIFVWTYMLIRFT